MSLYEGKMREYKGDEPANYIADRRAGKRALGLSKREHFAIIALQGLLASRLHSGNIYALAVESAEKLLEELGPDEE